MTYNTIGNDVTMAGGEGALLANRYRVVRQLGQGGMGSVWLAEDTQLDNKQFAIKMLPSILVSNKRAYRQLKDEALVAMKLTHPNIVTLRAFEENNGNPFLVMDYIDGQTLDDYLAEKGKLSEDEAVKLLKPIAAALDYAHKQGVVHRDVKPANIMIRNDGHPFILDFGISREIQETMTRVTGKLSSGTLLYMSPEQLNGDAPKSAQDVYSFAAMVYECIKGEPPFSRGQIEFQILNNPPPLLRSDDARVVANSVMAGLAKKPEDRPPTCLGVLEGNVSRRDAESQSGRDGSTSHPSNGRGKAIAILALLAALAGCGWWWMTKTNGDIGADMAPDDLPSALSTSNTMRVDESPIVPTPPSLTDDASGVNDDEAKRKAATKSKAKELMVAASGQVKIVQSISEADNFADKKKSLLCAFGEAEGHYKVNDWEQTIACFTSFTNDSEKLALLDRERNGAKASRETAVAVQTAARDAGAEQYANERWKGAASLMDEGRKEFDEMSFAEAKGKFDLAAEQFNLAATEAPKEKARQIAEQREAEEKAKAERERRAKWRKEGEQFTINDPYGLYMTMKWCPATTSDQWKRMSGGKNSFTMGSPTSEEGRYDNERQHEVTLTKGFWLGETEVTQGQWKMIMDGETVVDLVRKGLRDDTLYNFPGGEMTLREFWRMPSDGDPRDQCGDLKDDVPVYNVNWSEAVEFCRRLTQKERDTRRIPDDYEYRLPTEAEWEYACRASTTTALPNGIDIRILGENNAPALNYIAWYRGNSSVGFNGRGLDTTNWKDKQYPGGFAWAREVKGKEQNAWGLYDMIGNVYEWCEDYYGDYSMEAVTDPYNTTQHAYRAYRGGSWFSEPRYCRSAHREWFSPGLRCAFLGFRVALAPSHNAGSGGRECETSQAASLSVSNISGRPNSRGSGRSRTLTLPGGAPMEMIYVAPGSFMMGSPASEEGRKSNEAQHRVTLTKGYWLGKYEVTQKQWQSVMGEIPSYAELPFDYKGDEYPVIKVSWDDCQMFVRRVNLELNCGARLPTEAEWEYACRAGSTTAYHWGGALNGEKANCNGNFPYGTVIKGPYLQKPTPVGHYAANQWGFYDMHGNVREWCDDWYDKNFYADSPANDPHGPASGQFRVLRGGSMHVNANNCRSAFRIMAPPGDRSGGIRLCCDRMPNE